jgi:3-oxoacyl-[acyl-carrier-protein] synthase III
MQTAHSRFYGSGFVTGETLVSNERMAMVCDTTDEWIRERSGIAQRYFVNEGTATSDLALGALRRRSMTLAGRPQRSTSSSWPR